jgi:hypothetical protein
VGSSLPTTSIGIIHHVVVEQRTRVHEFERRAGVDVDLLGSTAACTDESPVAERWSEPLAASEHQASDLVNRLSEGGLEFDPADALGSEEFVQSTGDASSDFEQ